MDTEEDGIEWLGTDRLTELAYADDIGLLSEDVDSMKRVTEKVALEASKVGLKINRTKTKVMTVQPREDISIALEDEAIRRVETFEYLGSVVRRVGDVRKEAGIRVGKAGAVLRG